MSLGEDASPPPDASSLDPGFASEVTSAEDLDGPDHPPDLAVFPDIAEPPRADLGAPLDLGPDGGPCTGLACGPFIFLAPSTTTLPPLLHGKDGLAARDLDGDGRIDLVAASGRAAQVLFNAGAGIFAPPVALSVLQNGPEYPQIADFDGDKRPDVLVHDFDSDALLFLNRGGRQFGAPIGVKVGGPRELATADLNHDGRPDLVAAGTTSAVWITVNRGAGTFDAPRGLSLDTWATPADSEVSDFDRDGQPDIVTLGVAKALKATRADEGFYVLYLGANLDVAARSHQRPDNNAFFWDLAPGDIDGDGRTDLVIAVGDNNKDWGLSVYFNKGGRDQWTRIDYPFGACGGRPLLADFDRDGKLDIVTFGWKLCFRKNLGGRALALRQIIPIAPILPQAGTVADLDGDSRPDIVIGSNDPGDKFSQVHVFLNRTP